MENKFLGKGWKFPVKVDKSTGRIMTSEYEEDVKEALNIILKTCKGERIMRSEFGSKINNYVFEYMNFTNINLLKKDIEEAILHWEPRVKDVKVTVANEISTKAKLIIEISYVVRKTNNLFNLVYPFYINEGTKAD